MSETLEATFRIVTPMFLGGADQESDTGIRPPSVKGALRFWWRALNWGRFRAETETDEAALGDLHKEEARLFGSAADDNGGGQGTFLLRVARGSCEADEKEQRTPGIQETGGRPIPWLPLDGGIRKQTQGNLRRPIASLVH